MKKIAIVFAVCVASTEINAQSNEAQQLLLNWEKLTQFKKILQNMYDGYKVLHKGYTAVKDISAGNFHLHKAFLDALLEISPAVKKYKRIADVTACQFRIVNEYKSAFNHFKESGQFTLEEIRHLETVYANLLRETVKSLEELLLVITAGELRMTDDERLAAIDRIYEAVVDQFSFLRDFNNNTSLLEMQRKGDQTEIKMSRIIRGIK